MITIKIVALGKLKESYLREACAEYQKRLQAFCKLQITELTPYRLPDDPSAAQICEALDKEADEIEKHIPSNAFVYAMCIEGASLTSERFAAQLEHAAVIGGATVTFVIGSSYGLSDRIKQRAQTRLSLSAMTFPHQLSRVMLLEQIYRAFQIRSGGKYHK